jgi:hypothetical protein
LQIKNRLNQNYQRYRQNYLNAVESKKMFNSRKSYAIPVKKEIQEYYNIETLKNFVEKE